MRWWLRKYKYKQTHTTSFPIYLFIECTVAKIDGVQFHLNLSQLTLVFSEKWDILQTYLSHIHLFVRSVNKGSGYIYSYITHQCHHQILHVDPQNLIRTWNKIETRGMSSLKHVPSLKYTWFVKGVLIKFNRIHFVTPSQE